MATATLAVTITSQGNPWTVTITDINGGDLVKDTETYINSYVNATNPNIGALFQIDTNAGPNNNKFNGYPGNYITWRSTRLNLTYNQYPTLGWSLDIWSNDLYTDIITNSATWDDLAATQDYSLNDAKHSLVYNYENFYAPVWSKGGSLTITVA